MAVVECTKENPWDGTAMGDRIEHVDAYKELTFGNNTVYKCPNCKTHIATYEDKDGKEEKYCTR